MTAASFGQEAIITGYIDAPCSGATPRTVEIYVDGTIDFTDWDLARQSNGGVSGSNTGLGYASNIDLSGLGILSDTFAYITNNSATLDTEFGITTNVIQNSNISSNGDDAFQITDNMSNVIDRFGELNVDGTGTAWEHVDTFYYRVDGTPANGGSFVASQFTYGTQNLFDGECGNLSSLFSFGTYSTTASTTPTVNVTGSVNLFYFEGNGPSSESTISVSGINLGDVVLVSAPANFEVASMSGGTFGPFVTITPSGATLDPTNVFIRLASGLTPNSYSGDVTVSSGGAMNAILAVSGQVDPADPQISTSGGIFGLEYVENNGPSNDDSFGVSGLFLGDDITVTAPMNFEVSLTTGTGFADSITISPDMSGTVPSTDVFVRLKSGLSVGDYSGNVTLSSAGVMDVIEATSASVTPQPTCANPGDIFISEVMRNPAAVSDGNGEYFEVYNNTSSDIDMIGWVIKDDASSSESHTITSSAVVPMGGYFVFVINGNSAENGGITGAYSYDGDISLGNSNPDGIIIECSGTVIDQVIFDGTFPPATSGNAMELSNTLLARFNNLDNDNGANWGLVPAGNTYGAGDLGTPGAANAFALSTDNFEVNKFSIFPNPTNTGEVNISSVNATPITVTVFDILGKQVKNATISNNRLDVSNLKSGIYLLRLTQDGATSTKKLVIR